MSDRTTSQWRVKVNGGTQVGVRPGESLEIGRKPLRPLPDTGVARLEIEDSAKSMSKRHALFTVTAEGDALLRDLNSTNGSYVVNADGELMRLPAGRDFPLPTSPIRLQFGDVPIDFMRVEQHEPASKPFTPHVPNLFDYSSPTSARQEPDAADMSVADILDLRAGEPTAVFAEQSSRPAAKPLTSLAGVSAGVDGDAAAGIAGTAGEPTADAEPESDFHVDFASVTVDTSADGSDPSDTSVVEAVASDADAATTSPAGTDAAEAAATAEPAAEEPADAPSSEDGASADASPDFTATAEPIRADTAGEPAAHSTDSMPLRLGDRHASPAPRDLFADAMNAPRTDDADTDDAANVEASTGATPAFGFGAGTGAGITTGVQPAQDNTVPMGNRTAPTADHLQERPQDHPAERVVDQTIVAGNAPVAQAAAFEPEPGSVFEKVSNGDFDRPQPRIIEAGGYTSEDARHTTDMTKQFEMARHRELLPFLAMNPALYDDLYAWLAAQGNRDIDEALAHNAGYQDYREAVGK